MQHRGINAENLAELSGLTQRALRVAPDMSLIQLLRKLGWTGTTFAPFTLDDQVSGQPSFCLGFAPLLSASVSCRTSTSLVGCGDCRS